MTTPRVRLFLKRVGKVQATKALLGLIRHLQRHAVPAQTHPRALILLVDKFYN